MAAAFLAAGCMGENKDISNLPEYAPSIGKTFRTKVELVVYVDDGTGGKLQIERVGTSISLPPADKMPKTFPYKYSGAKLLGILPVGSEFKLVKVKEEGQGFVRSLVEVTKSADPQWVGRIVYPSGLTGVENGKEATFDSKYVEEVPAAGK